MYHNLKDIENYSLWNNIRIMFMTVFAVLGKDYIDHGVYGVGGPLTEERILTATAKLTEEEPKQHDTEESEQNGQTDHCPAFQP